MNKSRLKLISAVCCCGSGLLLGATGAWADCSADAGPDLAVCGTGTLLLASEPAPGASGNWSILSGAGGSLNSPSQHNSAFLGQEGTAYTLQWEVNDGVCTEADQTQVSLLGAPGSASAGADQQVCADTTNLAATAPSGLGESGTWSVVSGDGNGSIANPGSPGSAFSGTYGTTYTLRWTNSNGVCPGTNTDDVDIEFGTPVIANAGADQDVCGTMTFLGATGTGSWSILSGAGGLLGDANSATSSFQGVPGTTYVLQWTQTDGFCSNTDTVSITFFDNPTPANAGPDQQVCGIATLAGNTPVGVQNSGMWSEVAGDGNGLFTDASSPTTGFTGTPGVTHTLRWTIGNGVCPSSSDDVQIQVSSAPVANAGADQQVCGTMTTMAAVASLDSNGSWSIISGAGGSFGDANSATSTFSGQSGVSYVLQWTESNPLCGGASDSDTVTVTFYDNPTPASAGADQFDFCSATTTLAGNSPGGFAESGTWSEVAGDGNGVFASASSPTSGFTATSGVDYTLRWTIGNGVCPVSSDDVAIRSMAVSADAGPDQSVAGGSTNLAAVLLGGSTGSWSILSGTGGSLGDENSATSSFSGVPGTTYTLRWTEDNGTCDGSDTVQIELRVVGVTVDPTTGLTTAEDGTQASFTVVLDGAPTADVTIPVSSSDTGEGTVSPDSLTFTTGNWNVPQTVTVTGVDDSLDDGDVPFAVVVGDPASADAAYDALGDGDTADVNVVNSDDDSDGDGIPGELEAGAPNPGGGGSGDGNGDGVQDSQQTHVASLQTTEGDYLTLANGTAGSGNALDAVGTEGAPDDAPYGVDFPFGLVHFTVSGVGVGGSVEMSVYVPYDANIVDYFKWDRNALQWASVGATVEHIPTGNPTNTRLTFTLVDGDRFDVDTAVDGSIEDPGGPVTVAAAVPGLGAWGLGLLGLLLSGLAARVASARRSTVVS